MKLLCMVPSQKYPVHGASKNTCSEACGLGKIGEAHDSDMDDTGSIDVGKSGEDADPAWPGVFRSAS